MRTHRDMLPENRVPESVCNLPAKEPVGGFNAWWDEMAFAVPKFPRNQVDKAGFVLADPNADWKDEMWALSVINNWRSAHIFPLNNFQNNMRFKVKGIQSDILIAQRIKRLESIRAKLLRDQTSTLQLSQMQDIGGCRAILKSCKNVALLVEAFHHSRFNHKLKSVRDYVLNPKGDGYRGHHLVYQYQSLEGQIAAYDKLRIEIQIRSALQHAWATAVEAVGIFTQQALKSAQGSEDWRRLFALMSTAIAIAEKSPMVPGTPDDPDDLRKELQDIVNRLNAEHMLGAYRSALNFIGGMKEKASKYFLVHYVAEEHKVWVTGFG